MSAAILGVKYKSYVEALTLSTLPNSLGSKPVSPRTYKALALMDAKLPPLPKKVETTVARTTLPVIFNEPATSATAPSTAPSLESRTVTVTTTTQVEDDGFFDAEEEVIEEKLSEWKWDPKADLATKQRLLKEKIDANLIDTIHNQVLPSLVNLLSNASLPYGASYAIWMMPGFVANWAEMILSNLLANVVLHIEKETGNPFPKENTLFALLDYLSKSTAHAQDFYEQFSAIEENAALNPAQKAAAKLAVMQEVTAHLLAIACPNKGEDLPMPEFPSMVSTLQSWMPNFICNAENKTAHALRELGWNQIQKHLPDLLVQIVDPMVKSQKQAAATEKFLNEQPGGKELLNLVRLAANQVQKVTSSLLMNQGQDVLLNAEAVKNLSKTEKMIYQLAVALGADQSKAFTTLIKQLGSYIQPVLLHVIGHLVKDKGMNHEHVLTYILNKLSLSAFEFSQAHGAELDAAYKAGNVEAMRVLFVEEARRVVKMVGLDHTSLAGLLPMGAGAEKIEEVIVTQLVSYYVEFYCDVIVAQRSMPTFSRPLEGMHEAAKTLDAIVAKTVVPALKGVLKEPESPLGKTFVDLINGLVFEKGVAATPEFYTQALKDIADKPVFDKLGIFLSGYVSHSLLILLGNLAASNPDNVQDGSAVDFWTSALKHLVKIVATAPEIDNPELVECLTLWKQMPETTIDEKAAKEAARAVLVKSLIPVSKRLMEAMGANIDENLLIPASSKKKIKELLTNSVLPGLIFDVAGGMAVPPAFTADEQARLARMNGVNRLDLLSNKLTEMLSPTIKSSVREFSYLIANKVNEKTANSTLSTHDEALLGHAIQDVIVNPAVAMKTTWYFVDNTLQTVLAYGLKKMALNYKGPDQGDALANIIMQLRIRFAEQSYDSKLYKRIETFVQITAGLHKLEDELSALRSQATAEAPKYSEGLLAKIEAKAAEVQAESARLEQTYHYKAEQLQLLAIFKTLATQLLADMGFEKATDLPLYGPLQKSTFEALRDGVLPDQLMRAYYDHLRFHPASAKHKQNLDARSPAPAGQKHGKFVKAAGIFADTALKYGDNWVIANATSLADLILQGMDIPVDMPAVPKVGAKVVVNGKVLGKDAPGKNEFLWNSARKEVKGALLQIMDNFMTNVRKLEQDDPQRMFGMMISMVQHMAGHLATINGVAAGQQMHAINPADVVAAMGDSKHAATPDAEKMRELAVAKQELAAIPEAATEAEKLAALKKVRELEDAIHKQMDEKSFKKFTEWFLKMAGIEKAEDLRVSPALQPLLWKQLHNTIGPSGLRSTFGTLSNPEMMNMMLMKLLAIVDQSIGNMIKDTKKGVVAGAPKAPRVQLPRKDENVASFVLLVQQISAALPDTWTNRLLNISKVSQLSGDKIEAAARAALEQWMLEMILEVSFDSGSENVPKDPLPVTPEEVKAAKDKGTQENVANKAGFTTKSVSILDKLTQFVEVTANMSFLGWILMKIVQLPLYGITALLGRSVSKNAEHVRKNIVDMPVHANLGFHWLDDLMEAYPV